MVAIDFSSRTPSGEYLLVLIDEYSRYPILRFTSGLTSSQAISACKEIFKLFGTPQTVKSDNGPAFASFEFREFAKAFGFKHMKITPEHPQSNSICERFMANINKQIRCAIVEGKNWKQTLHNFLRDYRATPHSTTGVSPNDLFEIKNADWPSVLGKKSQEQTKKLAKENDKSNKLKIAEYANKYQHTKTNKLEEGDVVLYKWKKTNKYQTTLDPQPYKIEKIKGSMITAKRPDHQIVRDCERFKKVKEHFFAEKEQTTSTVSNTWILGPPVLPINPIQDCLLNRIATADQPDHTSTTQMHNQTTKRRRGRPRKHEQRRLTTRKVYDLRNKRQAH